MQKASAAQELPSRIRVLQMNPLARPARESAPAFHNKCPESEYLNQEYIFECTARSAHRPTLVRRKG